MNVITSPAEDNEFFYAAFPVPILGILNIDDIGKHLKLDPDVAIDLRDLTKEQLDSVPSNPSRGEINMFESIHFPSPTNVKLFEEDFDIKDESDEDPDDDFEFDMSQLTALTSGGQYLNLGNPQFITGDPDAWGGWEPLNDNAGVRVQCGDECSAYLVHDYIILADGVGINEYSVLYEEPVGSSSVAGSTPHKKTFEDIFNGFMGV